MKKRISELLEDGEWVAFFAFMALVGIATNVVGAFLFFKLMGQQ